MSERQKSALDTPELDGWDEINNKAGRDSIPAQNEIKIATSYKTVQAMSNLSASIFSMQRALGNKLSELNEMLDNSNKASEKHSRRTSLLTVFLVIATIIQALAAVMILIR